MITYEYLKANDYLDSKKAKRDIEDINRLWLQLTSQSAVIDRGKVMLVAMLSHLLVARDEKGRIQGMATLGSGMPTLHGTIGFIEDVVVDESLRGRGVGEEVMTRLIQLGRDTDFHCIKLTSKPSRIAANKLYQKLGFQPQFNDTNHYLLKL